MEQANAGDTSSGLNGILSELKVDHQRILSDLHKEHRQALRTLQKKFDLATSRPGFDSLDTRERVSHGQGERVSHSLSFKLPANSEAESYETISPDNSESSQTFVLACQVDASRALEDESGRASRHSCEASFASDRRLSTKSCVNKLMTFMTRPHAGTHSVDDMLGSLATVDLIGEASQSTSQSPSRSPTPNGHTLHGSNSRGVVSFPDDLMQRKSSDLLNQPNYESSRTNTIANRKTSWSALGMEMQRVKTIRDSLAIGKFDNSQSLEQMVTWKTSYVGQVKSTLTTFRRSKVFEHLCGGVILFNCVVMGAMSQFSARDHHYVDKPPIYLDIADKFCSVWFFFELMLRFTVGPTIFFCGRDRSWNSFDFILVSFDVSDNALRVILGSGGTPVRNLVALRLLRIFRVLRIVRLLKFCRDLQLILLAIRQCGRALFWALVLVALIDYLFSMYFLQTVTDYLMRSEGGRYDSVLQKQWGSLFAASYTLYAVMCGGVSWMEVADPLIDIHWVHGLALFFYVAFTLFVVTNIITSIFVDTAIQSGNQDREEVIARKLAERDEQLAQMTSIFQDADEDGSGLISLEQFQRHMHDPRVRAYLRSVDLDVTEATSLFTLLDTDGSGHISITEFVFGCMRLKGTARSVDLAILIHDSKVLHDQLDAIRAVQHAQSNEMQQVGEVCRTTLSTTTRSLRSMIRAESNARLHHSGTSSVRSPRNKKSQATADKMRPFSL